MTLLEPNVLYLEEKPHKIVKSKKSKADKTKKPTKKKDIKKTLTKIKKSSMISLKATQIPEKYKQEVTTTRNKKEIAVPNDPLFTPQAKIKIEETEEKFEREIKLDDDDNGEYNNFDRDYKSEEYEDDDDYDDEDYKYENKDSSDEDDDDDEDEPLILLTRPSKYMKNEKYEYKTKMECRSSCKQRCNEKFTEEQRRDISAKFRHLSETDKHLFLRKHIKTKPLLRYKCERANRRSNNYCYYLTKINVNVSEDPSDIPLDILRVCRKYFESTLSVNDHYLKKALTGYELEVDNEVMQLVETNKVKKEKDMEQSQEIKHVLDPTTGILITIDPKDKTKKSKMSPAERKAKRKLCKPKEPVQEHFPKPISCALKCLQKCHTKFTEQERKQICDTFWSMDYKNRKNYILSNIEVKKPATFWAPEFRTSNRTPRKQQTHYFLRAGLHCDKKRVCKHFVINTLCISKAFIGDAIDFADKTTGYYKGEDRRQKKVSEERLKSIFEHINSYPTWVPSKTSKTKYLHHSLNIKKLFEHYKEKCQKENIKFVSKDHFNKLFHQKFPLLFLAKPNPKKKKIVKYKKKSTIAHYTGEEPGGYWLDSKGDVITDITLIYPAQNIKTEEEPSQIEPQESCIVNNSSQDTFLNIVIPASSTLL